MHIAINTKSKLYRLCGNIKQEINIIVKTSQAILQFSKKKIFVPKNFGREDDLVLGKSQESWSKT